MADAYVDSQGVVHEANAQKADGTAVYVDAKGVEHKANVSTAPVVSSSGSQGSSGGSTYGGGIDWSKKQGGQGSKPVKSPTKPIVTKKTTKTGNVVKTVATPAKDKPTTMTMGRGGTKVITPVTIEVTTTTPEGEVISRRRGRGEYIYKDNKAVVASNLPRRVAKPSLKGGQAQISSGAVFTGPPAKKGTTLRQTRDIVGQKIGRSLAPLFRSITGEKSPEAGVAFVKSATYGFLAPSSVLMPSEEVVAASVGGSLVGMMSSSFLVEEAAGSLIRSIQKKRQTTFIPGERGGTVQFVEPTEEGFRVKMTTKKEGVVISELPGGFSRKEIPVEVTSHLDAKVVSSELRGSPAGVEGVTKGLAGSGEYSSVAISKSGARVSAGGVKFSAGITDETIIATKQKILGERIADFDITFASGDTSVAKVKQTYVKVPGGEVSRDFGAFGANKDVGLVSGKTVTLFEPEAPPFSQSSLNTRGLPSSRPGPPRTPSQLLSLGGSGKTQALGIGEALTEKTAISIGKAEALEADLAFGKVASVATSVGETGAALISQRSVVTAPDISPNLDAVIGRTETKEAKTNIQEQAFVTGFQENFAPLNTLNTLSNLQSPAQDQNLSSIVNQSFAQGQAQTMRQSGLSPPPAPTNNILPGFAPIPFDFTPGLPGGGGISFKLPKVNLNPFGNKPRKGRKSSSRSIYTPSLGAVLLDIKGPKPKGKLFGWKVRPKSGGWF